MSVRPSVCPSVRPSVRPSVDKVSVTFWKKLLTQLIPYLAFTLMGWVSWPLFIFVFLASFLALWWPNIWPKMGFPELFENTICSIHFIPGIYTYGVRLLTPIHFRVPSLIFGPLVAKYWAENRVSDFFLIEIFIGYFWMMRWVVIWAGVYCPHLWAQFVYIWIVEMYNHYFAVSSLGITTSCSLIATFMGPTWGPPGSDM